MAVKAVYSPANVQKDPDKNVILTASAPNSPAPNSEAPQSQPAPPGSGGVRLLCLSNGHGEDLNTSLILDALQHHYPGLELAAMPLVGTGNAYRRLQVPIVGPTQAMPSGGIVYMNPLVLLRDLWSGLPKLLWQQWQAIQQAAPSCDLILATGDLLVVGLAHLTGCPYVAFLVSTSSYYEGRLRIPWLLDRCLRSDRCLQIYTRDAFSAEDLHTRGIHKAMYAGYPIMDILQPTGQALGCPTVSLSTPLLALLPGSRLPEAFHNFALQLKLCEAITALRPPTLIASISFCAALVPQITIHDLVQLAQAQGWQHQAGPGTGSTLTKLDTDQNLITVYCYHDAFADILNQCQLAIGMAGTAVEQAVGLGKPVIQIAGNGPQFTYRFAEAQMRLLGISVQTIGTQAATPEIIQQAAIRVWQTLQDQDYLQACRQNGLEHVGTAGGSLGIAHQIAARLGLHPIEQPIEQPREGEVSHA
jgi:uncharacterized protein (TIGR03492 family)